MKKDKDDAARIFMRFYSSTSLLCCKMAVLLGIKGEIQNGKLQTVLG